MRLILGSQSPRRKEILSYFSIPFVQASPDFDESSIPFNKDPEEYVCAIAKGKAKALAHAFPEDLILTADTIVYCEGKIYGKPKSRSDAFQGLSELAGRWHTVFTGVTLMQSNKMLHQAEATRVLFNPLTSEEIDRYLERTKWEDKAGGYGYQMEGGIIVRKIEGCYYNVIGLPINTTFSLLKQFGIHYL